MGSGRPPWAATVKPFIQVTPLFQTAFNVDNIIDHVLGKRVLTYWDIWGKREHFNYSQMSVFIVAIKTMYSWHYEAIHLVLTMISHIFPTFPSTLVPFSRTWNHMSSLSNCRVPGVGSLVSVNVSKTFCNF